MTEEKTDNDPFTATYEGKNAVHINALARMHVEKHNELKSIIDDAIESKNFYRYIKKEPIKRSETKMEEIEAEKSHAAMHALAIAIQNFDTDYKELQKLTDILEHGVPDTLTKKEEVFKDFDEE